ncbi:long-chain fatty acid--CoA ligase [Rhodococcus sp. WS4]|nr:long-chain fatty acid--CoA ligase [Rhodococcus sp. WS4]
MEIGSMREALRMNPWAGSDVAEMLDGIAADRPAHVAIVDGDVRITYQELKERRDALAAQFAGLGVRPGTNVGLLLGNHWQTVVTVFAALYVGARVVPFNLMWEGREIRYALELADVDVLIAGSHHRGDELAPKLVAAGIGTRSSGPVTVAGLPRLERVVFWHRHDNVLDADSLNTLLDKQGASSPPRATVQESYLLFTSGSTGEAKGALLRQDAALGTSFYFGERLGLTEDDRFLNTLPFYHGGGLLTHLLGVLQRGATIYLFEGFDHDAMVETLNRERCTAIGGFDIVNMRLVHAQKAAGRPLSIEKMQVTSERAFSELASLGVKCATVYALTEASNFVAMTPARTIVPSVQGNGQPFPGVEVRIMDYETRKPVPVGQPGEICFRGWNTMVGYYRMEDLTRTTFDDEGFLHTGDYGSVDSDGQIFYRGRYSAMIKTGGENVSELEVERFLTSELPGITNAGVVGVPDQQWGEVVIAFVETTGQVDSERLRDACRGKLAGYKIPKHFLEIESGAWPVTPTGKLVKTTLRARAAEILGAAEDGSREPQGAVHS